MYVPWDKTHQLTLKRTVARDKKKMLMTIIDDPSAGVLNPIPILKLYISRCHPEAKFFYSKCCIDHKGIMSDYQRKYPDRTIWYYPGQPNKTNYNVGKNKLGEWQKELALTCGAPNFEKCTGHGLRKACITSAVDRELNPLVVANIARHSSLNSQAAYAKNSSKRKGDTAKAVSMTGGRSMKKQDKKSSPVKKKSPRPSMNKPVLELEKTIVRSDDDFEAMEVLDVDDNSQASEDVPLSAKEQAQLFALLKKSGLKTTLSNEKKSVINRPKINTNIRHHPPQYQQQHVVYAPPAHQQVVFAPQPMSTPQYMYAPPHVAAPIAYSNPYAAPQIPQYYYPQQQQVAFVPQQQQIQYAPVHYGSRTGNSPVPIHYEQHQFHQDDPYASFYPDEHVSEFGMSHDRHGNYHGHL